MLDELKFVQGAVASKELVQGLTHFRIQGGHIQGFNGRIALSSPIAFAIDCTPKASTLVSAISRCEEAVQLGMTPTGRLSIKSGKFRSYVDCITDVTPHVEPEGVFVDIDGAKLLEALVKLQPFIATDAARPWSTGVLFSGTSAYATNNVVIAQCWLGAEFPTSVNIPRDAVKELIRLKKVPVKFQMSPTSLTVHYEDGRWMRTALITTDWPDLDGLLNREHHAQPVPDDFFTGLECLKPFVDKFGRVILDVGHMRTSLTKEEEGGAYELDWLTNRTSFQVDMLLSLKGVATMLDLSSYPAPCAWFGKNGMRGMVMGLHLLEDV